MKQEVEKIYNKWQEFKDNAEQYLFPKIYMADVYIKKGYKDLQQHWNDDHANTFIKTLKKIMNIK